MFETLKTGICSIAPLALLYKTLLSDGNDLSFTIIPSILNDAADLNIDPMFLGSVTSSRAIKFTLSLVFFLINSFKLI